MVMGGKSSKTSVGSTQAPPMPSAPVLGADPAAMAKYNTQLDAYNAQQAQIKKNASIPKYINSGIPNSGIGIRTIKNKDYVDIGDILKKPEKPTGIGPKDLLAQTTMNVSNPYGTSKVIQNKDGTYTTVNELSGGIGELFNQAFSSDAGKGYSDALMARSRQMIDPVMAQRGLPQGSEINDAALLRAALDAQIGGQQMLNQDRGLLMSAADRASGARGPDVLNSYQMPYQSEVLPYMQQIARDNLIYGNQAADARQTAANKTSKKGSTMGSLANLGSAGIGLL